MKVSIMVKRENVIFIYNRILFSHQENEILSFAGKWVGLENIILSEVFQVQKAKKHVFSHMWNIDIIQIQRYEKQFTLRGGHI
jgi:hypothetical protein